MLVSLNDIIKLVKDTRSAVPAFNVFGYEDAAAVIEAAELRNAPVILATNKVAIQHMPIEYLGQMYTAMAKKSKVPICVHLDHGQQFETVAKAIMSGYTSVMFDGSQLPLDENIKQTKEIVKLAHSCNIPIEAEIGSVGYNDPNLNMKHELTDPNEAKWFVDETKVDALAVAVGSLHRMEKQAAKIQFDRLEEIKRLINTPLVIHGSSGIVDEDLKKLGSYNVVKVNVGTALRMVFGKTLRDEINENPNEFDRIKWFKKSMVKVKEEAINKFEVLGL